ncbi:peptidylprolyl isomerase [Phenylobacterium immobile]|uniref:peptidylprolyl isomerase n=1 Tax=Phenylobacterium immobile TaxID=21 RepID=UPI000A767992|nr:peptidylprolyl isomerase [Phenylobacterium immobile]
MLTAFRAFAKSWVAAVLIGLLVVSFAVFGLNDVFRTNFGGAVIVAGSRKVQPAEFKQAFERYKADLDQRFGQPIPLEMAIERGVDRQVLTGMAEQASLAALLDKMGVRAADTLVAKQIAQIPAFFDRVSGRFDKTAYASMLAQNGLTTERFEQDMRDEIATQHLQSALFEQFEAPRAYGALAAIYGLESHDIGYVAVQPQNVPAIGLPTDAQLQAFMDENRAQLLRPEQRVLTVVRFDPALAGAATTVDPAELQKRYAFRKDTLSTPETRSLVQIAAKDAAAAQRIAAQLQAGAEATTVAKSVGVDAINYADRPQTSIADRKAAAAIFATPAGAVRTVQGDLGLSVVKVLKITPGRQVGLEEIRPQLEAEIRKEAAAEKVYALSQAYEDAHQKGASLSEAAQKAGVAAVTIGPLSKDGRDDRGAPVAGLTQKLVETAFELPAGGESDVTAEQEGRYFAVRVERVIAPAMPPMAEVKPALTRVWTQREMMKRLQAKADELSVRLSKGESLAAIGAGIGVQPVRVAGLDRRNAGQHPNFSPDFLTKALEGKAGDVFTGQIAPFGVAVAKIEATRPGDPAQLALATQQTRPQMTGTLLQELVGSLRAGARNSVKPKVDANAARAALGLPPIDAKADAPKKATP